MGVVILVNKLTMCLNHNSPGENNSLHDEKLVPEVKYREGMHDELLCQRVEFNCLSNKFLCQRDELD